VTSGKQNSTFALIEILILGTTPFLPIQLPRNLHILWGRWRASSTRIKTTTQSTCHPSSQYQNSIPPTGSEVIL